MTTRKKKRHDGNLSGSVGAESIGCAGGDSGNGSGSFIKKVSSLFNLDTVIYKYNIIDWKTCCL